MNGPSPIDQSKIVEAVITWAQTSDPVARQTAWSAVVDLMNRKTWDAQIAMMPQRIDAGLPAEALAKAGRQTPDAGRQMSACQIKQPPY